MFPQWKTLTNATMLATMLSLLTIAPVQAQEIDSESPAQIEQMGPQPDAGFFTQTGGAVKRKLSKTQTTATTFGETAGWFTLPLANLSYTVAAGDSDLFNVSFTAECRLFNGGADDYLRIRILDTTTGAFLEPYDGAQAFCNADAYATHTGMWSQRLGAGVHNFQVQFRIFDGAPAEVLTAWIDDWTFETVVYN
jgi:hypothetical protein